MFRSSDFKIRKLTSYPYINQTWQSWYSPILSNRKQEDGGYSACVTLGASLAPGTDQNEVIFLSAINGLVSSSIDLIKHIKALKEDYLNKTITQIDSPRSAGAVIFEYEKGKIKPILNSLGIENLVRFHTEYNGGDDLDSRVHLALPFVKKVGLTNAPGTGELRPDDQELMARCLSYPDDPESYAMVSAFVQAILYAKRKNIFPGSPQKPNSGRKVFYGVQE